MRGRIVDLRSRSASERRSSASQAEFNTVGEFMDAAMQVRTIERAVQVSRALRDQIAGNGVRTAIVDGRRGGGVLTTNGDWLDGQQPSRVMTRQTASAFHQYEKVWLVRQAKCCPRPEPQRRWRL